MSSFPEELRAVLARVLGEEPPEPDRKRQEEPGVEPVGFLRQWLAERNLGLVPVADAASFAWAGYWIARVRNDGDHAVLMFGSPSGPVYDPAGAVAAGGTIAEGWVVARLDLHLPAEQPYGTPAAAGAVAGLLVAPEAEAPLVRVEVAAALAGRGLDGDRYAVGRGTFGGARGYQLTLVEAEALEDVGLGWEEARRNVVTRGIRLNALVGRRFRVGEVECVGRRLAEPCAHLERLTRPGLLRPLVHRAGLRADILTGGTMRVGDAITPL